MKLHNALFTVFICVLCFVVGIATAKIMISIELQSGPVFCDTELTTYLQELYRSSYNAGMMRGLAKGYGYEDMIPMHEQYYDWMKAHYEDEEEALKQEGWYYLQDEEAIRKYLIKTILGLE